MTVDPVCKMEVEDTDPELGVEFNGTAYFFCSPICKQAFEREPTKYVKEAEVPIDPEAAA